MTKAQEIARAIKQAADLSGWTMEVRGCTLTIRKNIVPGSNESFVEADGSYWDVLGLLPQSGPGSTWGTDGSGIGGVVAMRSGLFVMNKSGGNKNVLKELAKMIQETR